MNGFTKRIGAVERGGKATERLPRKRQSGIPHASYHDPLVGGGYFPVVSRIAALELTTESVPLVND